MEDVSWWQDFEKTPVMGKTGPLCVHENLVTAPSVNSGQQHGYHLGHCQKYRISGLTSDLLHMNLQLSKFSRGFTHSTFEKHESHSLLPQFVSIMESSECGILGCHLRAPESEVSEEEPENLFLTISLSDSYNHLKFDKTETSRA